MAIKASAGSVSLSFSEVTLISPTMRFNCFATGPFSYSFWVKFLETPIGQGSICELRNIANTRRFSIGYSDSQFIIQGFDGTTVSIQPLTTILLGVWQVFCVTFEHPLPGDEGPSDVLIYRGIENPSITADPVLVLIGTFIASADFKSLFNFGSCTITTTHTIAICNLKYTNVKFDSIALQEQPCKWDASGASSGTTTTPPKWASPLRTPGDISNIVVTTASGSSWDAFQAYNSIVPSGATFEVELPDPKFMALNRPCPTWIYKTPEFVFVNANPGLTPAVPTIYKSTPFWLFEDRGSLPINPTSFSSPRYFATSNFAGGGGVAPTDAFPLFYNETGAEVAIDFGNPANLFSSSGTSVPIPVSATIDKIYKWKFSAQFNWGPPAGLATATGFVAHPFLLITFVGLVTGQPIPILDDQAGLFAIKPDALTDKYNGGVEVKIPDPTIRTAFIGE